MIVILFFFLYKIYDLARFCIYLPVPVAASLNIQLMRMSLIESVIQKSFEDLAVDGPEETVSANKIYNMQRFELFFQSCIDKTHIFF